jgi:major membrane immunogen (membrane-anchored lipoprotein)
MLMEESMKKFLLFLVIFLMFGLVGCGPSKKKATAETFYQYLQNTQDEYAESQSGNLKITVVSEGVTTELVYVYNYDGESIDTMKVEFTEGEDVMEAYIKEGYAYVNLNDVKTKQKFFAAEGKDIIDNYGFLSLTEIVFNFLDESLFGAFDVESNKDGEATLVWDAEKYVFLDENIPDEEFAEAEERFREIQENIVEITMTIKYEGEKVTSLDSVLKNKDNEESQLKVEFNGTDTQTIEFPSDLSEYKDR